MRESNQRVPILGSIPLLGALFRTQSLDAVKTNLMVFIRVKILRDTTDTTTETNQKYRQMRDIQSQGGNFGMLRSKDRPQLPPIESYDNPAAETPAPEPDVSE